MTEDEFKALAEVMFRKERLNDLFLQRLIQHLALVVPEFDGQAFVEALYLQQASLPNPSQSEQAVHMLKHWKHKIDLTEKALADAEEMRSLLNKS